MFICICRSYICKGWVMAPLDLIYSVYIFLQVIYYDILSYLVDI